MAQTLGSVAVGTLVKLKENGAAVNYIVVNQGRPSSSYDTSCDGTWLLRQDIAENRMWDSGNSNVLESSDIHSYLNNTWINRYDTDIRNEIKQVKIPYRQNGGSGGTDRNGANGLSCKIFLLSGKEVGWDSSDNKHFPNDGAKLSYFLDGTGSSSNQKRVATLNGSAAVWWLRSPNTYNTNRMWSVESNGDDYVQDANNSYGVRPALVLPTTLFITDDGLVSMTAPPPNSLTVPIQAMQGNQITVSWSAVDGADGYILERKANTDADWTQVYSGANTSFEETVGTWTSVQYRVKAGVSGTYGDYTTSASVPVVSASAVVISGTDGDLGTLVNDVSYTVSSDGSTELTVVETINGTETRTYTATNGATNKIPVVDLPTGYGTISITASTNPGSGVVSVERNWTYSKEAITFPDAGGVADLIQNGQTIWAKTIAEAVRTPSIWGGNLGLALAKLAGAVLYNPNQVAKYSEVTVNLANVSVGQEVNLPYNGAMVPHIVVHIGNPNPSLYDASCDGVWLWRRAFAGTGVWKSTTPNTLPSSDLMTFMGNYVTGYDTAVQGAIKTVKIPYGAGNGTANVNSGANGLECKAFPLGGYEVGLIASSGRYIPVDGAKLDFFKSGEAAGTNAERVVSGGDYWLRSQDSTSSGLVGFIDAAGGYQYRNLNETKGYVPTVIMPTTFTATYYVGNDGSVHDEQEYEEAGTFTDISGGAIPMVQIETGSYTGTGTYGQSNPNTLNFPFEPKLVFLMSNYIPTSATKNMPEATLALINGAWGARTTFGLNENQHYGLYLIWEGNSLKFYNMYDAEMQFNSSNNPYIYIAIGLAGGETE